MEHRSCDCACCPETAQPDHKTYHLFPGVWLSYLPDAAMGAASGDSSLLAIVCRRGTLRFRPETGPLQSIHTGELAVWKAGRFLLGSMEPDESFVGFALWVDLKTLTEQPPDTLRGTNITGERLYDLYCARENMTTLPADTKRSALEELFYGQPENTALAWRKIGAQALLLWLGQREETPPDKEVYSSEQLRVVHEVHAYLTQHLDTRVTIEALSHRYLMNPTTLKQAFKSVYGTSIAAHMKEHRMGTAAQLLRETEQSMAEIARAVGYESQSKFTAAFKEYFGVLPKEYRKKD